MLCRIEIGKYTKNGICKRNYIVFTISGVTEKAPLPLPNKIFLKIHPDCG